jgi:hypothetical protein
MSSSEYREFYTEGARAECSIEIECHADPRFFAHKTWKTLPADIHEFNKKYHLPCAETGITGQPTYRACSKCVFGVVNRVSGHE